MKQLLNKYEVPIIKQLMKLYLKVRADNWRKLFCDSALKEKEVTGTFEGGVEYLSSFGTYIKKN